MAAPNTIKYSDVDNTGDTMLWPIVRQVLAISNM
jgi:hypothetical protein